MKRLSSVLATLFLVIAVSFGTSQSPASADSAPAVLMGSLEKTSVLSGEMFYVEFNIGRLFADSRSWQSKITVRTFDEAGTLVGLSTGSRGEYNVISTVTPYSDFAVRMYTWAEATHALSNVTPAVKRYRITVEAVNTYGSSGQVEIGTFTATDRRIAGARPPGFSSGSISKSEAEVGELFEINATFSDDLNCVNYGEAYFGGDGLIDSRTPGFTISEGSVRVSSMFVPISAVPGQEYSVSLLLVDCEGNRSENRVMGTIRIKGAISDTSPSPSESPETSSAPVAGTSASPQAPVAPAPENSPVGNASTQTEQAPASGSVAQPVAAAPTNGVTESATASGSTNGPSLSAPISSDAEQKPAESSNRQPKFVQASLPKVANLEQAPDRFEEAISEVLEEKLDATKLICTAVVLESASKTERVRARKLALTACNLGKQQNADLKIWVQTKETKVKSSSGRVLVTLR